MEASHVHGDPVPLFSSSFISHILPALVPVHASTATAGVSTDAIIIDSEAQRRHESRRRAAAQVMKEGPANTTARRRPARPSAGAAAMMDGAAPPHPSSTSAAQTERLWCSEQAEVEMEVVPAWGRWGGGWGEEGRSAAGKMRLFMNQRGGMLRRFQRRRRRSITSSWSHDHSNWPMRGGERPHIWRM